MIHFQKNDLTVFQSSLYMTTTAIIQSKDVVIMTDPCWLPNEVEEIRNYINEIIGNKQLYIIYTHSDFDHIIGHGAFPEAKIIASQFFADNPKKDDIIQEIHEFDQGYYLERKYEFTYPKVNIVIAKDGQQLQLGSMTLTFYLAPGHTNDSLFTVIEQDGIFLAGDYLSDVEFPFISGSFKDYVKTVEKAKYICQHHNISILVPGHGTVTQNQDEITKRINDSLYYLQQLPLDNSDLENYLKRKYKFYDGMKSIHMENKKLVAKEI